MRRVWVLAALMGCATPQHLVKPTWKISEPGSAPQSVPHYSTADSSAYVTLRLDGTASVAMVDSWGRFQKRETQLPSLGIVARIGSELVGTQIIRTVRIESVETGAATSLTALQATVLMPGIVGLTGQWTVSDRGEIEKFDVVVPKGKTPEMFAGMVFRLVFEDYFVALPDKAVGANALWTETSGGMLQSLAWDKTASYRVAFPDGAVAIDGSSQTLAQPGELSVSPKGDLKLAYAIKSSQVQEVASLESVELEGQGDHTFQVTIEMTQGKSKASMRILFKGTSRVRKMHPHFISRRNRTVTAVTVTTPDQELASG